MLIEQFREVHAEWACRIDEARKPQPRACGGTLPPNVLPRTAPLKTKKTESAAEFEGWRPRGVTPQHASTHSASQVTIAHNLHYVNSHRQEQSKVQRASSTLSSGISVQVFALDVRQVHDGNTFFAQRLAFVFARVAADRAFGRFVVMDSSRLRGERIADIVAVGEQRLH